MGFKLLEAVYRLPKSATSATEQSVLAALAFRANDETKLCFPTQGTLEAMTHLSRSTIAVSLNGLRENGIIGWESGGFTNKRGKYGQALANSYRFNLPDITPKAENTVSGSQTGQCPVIGQGSVREPDSVVSGSQTLQCTAAGHQQNGIRIGNTLFNTDTEQKAESGSGLKKLEESRGRGQKEGVVEYALRVLRIDKRDPEYESNFRTFSKLLSKFSCNSAIDLIDQVKSEIRQGEWDSVKNYPAVFVRRIQSRLGLTV